MVLIYNYINMRIPQYKNNSYNMFIARTVYWQFFILVCYYSRSTYRSSSPFSLILSSHHYYANPLFLVL